jgi:hypothetical protein
MLRPGSPPQKRPPDKLWAHYELWEKTQQALLELPGHFKSAISVSGIKAVEIFTFGQVLSSTIEEEVVRTLNDMREVWDPEEKYKLHEFTRRPEGFPDVILRHRFAESIIMGIELKSWYLLAKEGEPSFRFTVTPEACAECDLLVVVPWVLSNVLAGSPVVYRPYIELARYAAEYRNYWWKSIRGTKEDTGIISPSVVGPYPGSREQFADRPAEDQGKNFGRVARIGLMDEYVQSFENMLLLGIELGSWRQFFKTGGKTGGTKQKNILNQLGVDFGRQ